MHILMIIAPEDFRDEEFQEPYQFFRDNGATVTVASTTTERCWGKLGAIVTPDTTISECTADDYDAILLVGGPGSKQLIGKQELEHLMQGFMEKGKIVSAICFAPVILARAGLLNKARATVWNPEDNGSELEDGGAEVADGPVVEYGQLITANGPLAAQEFAQAIYRKLSQGQGESQEQEQS